MNPGNTLFRMVRSLANPSLMHGSAELQHGRMVMAVEAVDSAKQRGAATINDIAEELGIDQSGASRLMSQAISAGFVQRERADGDGRARECGLTPTGEELLRAARLWQEEVFQQLTHDWTGKEREVFAEHMQRILLVADKLSHT